MDFFPDVPQSVDTDESEEPPLHAWRSAPDDVLPGVVPVELILGRSDSTVVMLTGMRAFPTGLGMTLGVRVRGRVHRGDLHRELFDGMNTDGRDADWQAGRPLRVACQWPDQGIEMSIQEIQTQPLLDAAARAHPIW